LNIHQRMEELRNAIKQRALEIAIETGRPKAEVEDELIQKLIKEARRVRNL
jgi:hypothetical protein